MCLCRLRGEVSKDDARREETCGHMGLRGNAQWYFEKEIKDLEKTHCASNSLSSCIKKFIKLARIQAADI